jgi:transposase InsO family protein
MALGQRKPAAVIHHSDQGTQYTSIAFGIRCRQAGVRPSMGSIGDCFDNAMCESFFATLECELLERRRFKTQVEARLAIFDFIEGWYNPHRRHSALGYQSPIDYEATHAHTPTEEVVERVSNAARARYALCASPNAHQGKNQTNTIVPGVDRSAGPKNSP